MNFNFVFLSTNYSIVTNMAADAVQELLINVGTQQKNRINLFVFKLVSPYMSNYLKTMSWL